MKTILAIDTSTPTCSVALLHYGEITQKFENAQRHDEALKPMIQELIAQSGIVLTQLDGIICSIGPGAFTGLRVGASLAMGLGLGVNCPLLGISSLALLAAPYQGKVVAQLDARMGEIYVGCYENGVALVADILCKRDMLPYTGDIFVGAFTENDQVPEAKYAFNLIPHYQWQAPNIPLELNYIRNKVV